MPNFRKYSRSRDYTLPAQPTNTQPAQPTAMEELEALANPTVQYDLPAVSASPLAMPSELRQRFAELEVEHSKLGMEHRDLKAVYDARYCAYWENNLVKNEDDEGEGIEEMRGELERLEKRMEELFLEFIRLWKAPPLELRI